MFAEVKALLTYIEEDEESYDAKIIAEIKACALDLTTSTEIVLPGGELGDHGPEHGEG